MVDDALARSQAIGAARLLAEAAEQDIAEARAAQKIQVSANGNIGPTLGSSDGVSQAVLARANLGVNLSMLLYDGGRSNRQIDWRGNLAESARLGHVSQQEQLSLTTVSLALERSRFRLQAQVYAQSVRKMGCLVDALEIIVNADKGRLSELVQAKKSMQQAELAQTQAVSSARQVEVRLRRLVGDGLPPVPGLATVLLTVPDMGELQAQAAMSAEIAQLDAQAAAMKNLARSVEASNKPQLSWTANANAAGGALCVGSGGAGARGASVSTGVTVNIPLISPGYDPAVGAARKRAQATVLQREDALDARRYRIAEVHEQATAAFDRVKRVAAVLRDSEQVRNFTLQQWQQLGRRSLFDVMAAESEHYSLRVSYVNALLDGQQMNAQLLSLGPGVSAWLH
jgi:outer membrane protein TolC